MFSRAFLKLLGKRPQHGVDYWKSFIQKSIHNSKIKASAKWDARLQRPMYVTLVLEEVACEMSQKLGQAVPLDTIRRIEKEAQGRLDYLHQFALYCYMHEKNICATKD